MFMCINMVFDLLIMSSPIAQEAVMIDEMQVERSIYFATL